MYTTSRYYSAIPIALFSLFLFPFYVNAQYSIENCEDQFFEVLELCEATISLENQIIPDDGISVDSFDVDIEIDLWGDGTIDLHYRSDTMGYPNTIYFPPVRSNEQFLVDLPNNISYSCNDHKVSWTFKSTTGTEFRCQHSFYTIIEILVLGNRTINYDYNLQQQGPIYIEDLDFSNIVFSDVVADCGLEPIYSFENGFISSPFEGLEDYTFCDDDGLLFHYLPVYFRIDGNCDETLDSLILKINDQVSDVEILPYFGKCETLLGNGFVDYNVVSSNCEIKYGPGSLSCSPSISNYQDDYSSGMDRLIFSSNDQSLVGLTTKDLILLRNYILTGGSITDEFIFTADMADNQVVSTLDLVLLQKTIIMTEDYDFDVPWLFRLIETSGEEFRQSTSVNELEIESEYFNSVLDQDDFVIRAYKRGDLDGSYFNDNSSAGNCDRNTYDSIGFHLDDTIITTGDVFSFPVRLNEDVSLTGIHFGLSSDLVDNVTVESGVLTIGVNMSNSVDSNFVAIWMQNDLSRYEYITGEVLFTLTMTAKEDFNLSDLFQDTPEFPREIYINDDFETLTMVFGDYGLSSTVNADTDLTIDVYPNPFGEEFSIQLGDQALSEVSIEIFESDGRLVEKIDLGDTYHNQVISIQNRYTPGIKIIKLQSKEGLYIEKITSM